MISVDQKYHTVQLCERKSISVAGIVTSILDSRHRVVSVYCQRRIQRQRVHTYGQSQQEYR